MAKMRAIQPRMSADAERKKNRVRRDIIDQTVHWSEKSPEEMNERDWRIFKEDFMIVTKGQNVPAPMRSWAEANLPDRILDAVEEAGYKDPSPIQMQTIPIGLQGRNRTPIHAGVTFMVRVFSFLTQFEYSSNKFVEFSFRISKQHYFHKNPGSHYLFAFFKKSQRNSEKSWFG
eukprot:TRINITY_DN8203_c0_g1_i1.p1 TRINITY_DN8203_c0_g1~~TRINITY_DN8203_c0_g1_i1.p1  ORF type:complete len:174 (-),score=35.44 TRINITY_DN8203_c0_g1_i1:144-665(-)